MAKALGLKTIVAHLRDAWSGLEDHRTGKNIQYQVSDAAMSAFSVFFMQSPSFLDQQRDRVKRKGEANIRSLFLVGQIPSDNQIRNLLDRVRPQHIAGEFSWIYEELKQAGEIEAMRDVGGTLLIALDGVTYFESTQIQCEQCLRREDRNGRLHYYHSAITPVIVKPGLGYVFPLMPECIELQDGHEKQDCERNAAKRWLERYSRTYAERPGCVTYLGDDLYSNQPFCELVAQGYQQYFVCVAKPESHPALYEWIACVEALQRIHEIRRRHWMGSYAEIRVYRWATEGPLRGGTDALLVNWVELIVLREDTQQQMYHNTWVTNHAVTPDTVVALADAGRSRWKIENENNNVLKNHGYHLEHNFGHGQHHLSTLLFTLNLLAFLIHTAQQRVSLPYQLLRQNLSSRQKFFGDLRALTRYLRFESWDALFRFMLESLDVVFPATLFSSDTS